MTRSTPAAALHECAAPPSGAIIRAEDNNQPCESGSTADARI